MASYPSEWALYLPGQRADYRPGYDRGRARFRLTEFSAVPAYNPYIEQNGGYIPNYGERWRNGERISTAFAESTVNTVIGKRFAKKQQMQWSHKGAHLLLQMRPRVLNGELRSKFAEWYPGFDGHETEELKLAA